MNNSTDSYICLGVKNGFLNQFWMVQIFLVSHNWLLGLLNDGVNADVAGEQPSIEIPSPRMGRGGYEPQEFENESVQAEHRSPLCRDRADSEHSHERDSGVPLFPSRGEGGSAQSVSSVGSHEGSRADERYLSIVKRITNL